MTEGSTARGAAEEPRAAEGETDQRSRPVDSPAPRGAESLQASLPADNDPPPAGAAVECERCDGSLAADELTCSACGQLHAVWDVVGANSRASGACPERSAPYALEKRRGRHRERQPEDDLVLLVCLFGAMLVVSALAGFGRSIVSKDESSWSQELAIVLVSEIADTAFLIYALIVVRRPAPVVGRRRWIALVAALPLTLVTMTANLAYHRGLMWLVEPPDWTFSELGSQAPWGWTLATVCVQPTIVEELFFRYLFLGVLLTVLRPSTAIFISALLFGLAHSGVPLSIPYLTVLGLVLGALYHWGGLAAPMAMHFLHNLAVEFIDRAQ